MCFSSVFKVKFASSETALQSFLFHRFAAGLTLKKLQLTTTADQRKDKEIFGKKVFLDSFAIYWKPKDHLYADELARWDEDQIDNRFNNR